NVEREGQQTENTADVINGIYCALNDTSALLKHECGYCHGRMGNNYAIVKFYSYIERLKMRI
ncbi:unnamed protein product, partial [Rotaria sp. Silwood2]